MEARGVKNPDLLLRDIAQAIYIPGFPHVDRRRYILLTVKVWGDYPLKDIEADEVVNHPFSIPRSGSWKNLYITIFKEIYVETLRYGCKIRTPEFPTFARHSKKADSFAIAELAALFKPENFPEYQYFLFPFGFNTSPLCCGDFLFLSAYPFQGALHGGS